MAERAEGTSLLASLEVESLEQGNEEAVPSRVACRWRPAVAVGLLGVCCTSVVALGLGLRPGVSPAATSEGRLPALEALYAAAGPVRKGTFLVVGDWGYDEKIHGNVNGVQCQKAIASKMDQVMEQLSDVKFVINVGDSFYPGGVSSKTDWQWDIKWRNIFSRALRSIPWYSVYGNHDYHADPCACSDSDEQCAQVNYDIDNKDFFYMPGTSWFKEHPELDLEVVALDTNEYMWAWNRHAPLEQRKFQDCQWTQCQAKCEANAKARAQESFDMFYARMKKSTAKNLLVFSHYPTDYLWMHPEFLGNLSDASKFSIQYFGGHRHNVDDTSTISTAPNHNWLVGGGGGWGCEGLGYMNPPQQGFVVGAITEDGRVTTHPVFVDEGICCPY